MSRVLTSARLLAISVLPLAGLAMLASCQSTMSVEEAKKVTVAFSGSRFVPPPRTTNDVVAVLEQQRFTESDVTRELRAQAEQPRPDNAEGFVRRGVAAKELGRTRQAIADLTEATRLAPSRIAYVELARAEELSGNLAQAVEHLRNGLRLARTPGEKIFSACVLSAWYVKSGNLETGETALRECVQIRQELGSARDVPADWRSFNDGLVTVAQAAVAAGHGRFDEAERYRCQTVDAWATWATGGDARMQSSLRRGVPELARSELARSLARQGRLLEAENEGREALLRLLRFYGRNTPRTATVLTALSRVIADQGRHAEAEVLYREAIDIFRRSGAPADSFGLLLARSALASTLAAQQRWTDALAEYDRIRADLASDQETYARTFKLDVTMGLVFLKTGRTDDAIALLHEALEQSRRAVGEGHPNTAEIHGLFGMAYGAKGELPKAVPEFKAGIDVLLNRSVAVDDEATTQPMRDQRITLILELSAYRAREVARVQAYRARRKEPA